MHQQLLPQAIQSFTFIMLKMSGKIIHLLTTICPVTAYIQYKMTPQIGKCQAFFGNRPKSLSSLLHQKLNIIHCYAKTLIKHECDQSIFAGFEVDAGNGYVMISMIYP